MKILIKQLLRESLLNEYQESFEDIMASTTNGLLHMIHNQEPIKFSLIPKNQYHHALKEFMRYRQFVKFPTKYIYNWKNLLLNNIGKLEALTSIHGHTSYFPSDDFADTFDYNNETDEENNGQYTTWLAKHNIDRDDYNDFNRMYEFLSDVYNIDKITPQFTNGHHVLSDYATEPLINLGVELDKADEAEEIIVIINKILDVTHQRSDIAELFIEGGSDSLDYISNN